MKIPANTYQDEKGQWWHKPPSMRWSRGQRCVVAKCDTCGSEFVKYTSNATRYCSPECRRATCERCGEKFVCNGSNHRYCSKRCKMGERACETCGTVFVPKKNTKLQYCSKECFYEIKVPTGSVQHHPGGYRIVKVPRDTPGMRVKGNRPRWMFEHRYVMQQAIGRPLEDYERVHHKNGDRADNRPENLELWKRKSGGHPIGIRSEDYHCPGCRCFEHKEPDD